jgi:multisubunit Na+/H+ antiporter MnhB subunit
MSSLILRIGMRLLLPLTLLFGAFMALKGHGAPGGGFIGGLTIAVALAMYRMAYGAQALHTAVPVHPRILVLTGLALAVGTAATPLLFGEPVLRSYIDQWHWTEGFEPHFVSAVFFDIGVLLVVVGSSIGIVTRFSEELEA